MDKQAYLMQYGQLKRMIGNDRKAISRLKASMTDTSAPEIRDNPVQVSPDEEASFARLLEEIDRLEARVKLEKKLLSTLRAQILVLIGSLPSDKYDLMVARYISCMKWTEIMEEKYLTKPTVLRWHREILDSLTLPEDAVNIAEELNNLKKAS